MSPAKLPTHQSADEAKGALATQLKAKLSETGGDIDSLSAKTKIPRPTIAALMSEPVSGVLPERVYMRGHLTVLAKELGVDEDEALELFDQAHPKKTRVSINEPGRAVSTQAIVMAVVLGGLALSAVVLAFWSALS